MRRSPITPMASPSRINGTTRFARQSIFPDPAATPREASGRRDWIFVGMFRDVVDVYRPAFNDGSAGKPGTRD